MGFRVPGKVAKRLVEVGQTVDVGQPLATLDEVDLKLQAEQAEAEFRAATGVLAQAAAAEQRAKDLRAKGWATDATLDMPKPPATRPARASTAPSVRSISPRTHFPMQRWKPTPAASSPRPWSSPARWWRPGRPRSVSRALPKRKPWLRSPKRCSVAPRMALPPSACGPIPTRNMPPSCVRSRRRPIPRRGLIWQNFRCPAPTTMSRSA